VDKVINNITGSIQQGGLNNPILDISRDRLNDVVLDVVEECDEQVCNDLRRVAYSAVNETAVKVFHNTYPQDEVMIKAPLVLGSVIALLSALALFMVFIPSVTTTTLKLRCGVIPFLHSDLNFRTHHFAMDTVTMILGSSFWAVLYSSVGLGAIFGLVLFLFLWQVTSYHMQWMLAMIIIKTSSKLALPEDLGELAARKVDSLFASWEGVLNEVDGKKGPWEKMLGKMPRSFENDNPTQGVEHEDNSLLAQSADDSEHAGSEC